MCDIFMSYSHSRLDSDFARMLREKLKKEGLTVWMDESGIGIGEEWEDKITEAVETSLAFVLIFSSNSAISSHVKDELSLAAKTQIPIIPIRIEDLEPKGFFKLRLTRLNWVNIFEGEQKKIDEVVIGIKERIDKIRKEKSDKKQEEARPTSSPKDDAGVVDSVDEVPTAKLRKFLPDQQRDKRKVYIRQDFEEDLARSPERAMQVVQNKKNELKVAPPVSPSEWPDAGIHFLRNLHEKLQNEPTLNKLEFWGDQDIESEQKLRWFFGKKQGLGIRLIRWGKGVRIRWGLFSKQEKKDPEFRRIATDLMAQKILKGYDFFPNKKLRVSYNRFVEIEKLGQPQFQTEIYEGFVDFCQKVMPFGVSDGSNNDDSKNTNKLTGISVDIESVDKRRLFHPILSQDEMEDDDEVLTDERAKKRAKYNTWTEFEREQGEKDERKKNNLPIAKQIHDLMFSVLRDKNVNFEIRYGDGTFSLLIPKGKANTAKRTFARVGLLSIADKSVYLDTLYKGPDAIPPGGIPRAKDDSTKYFFRIKTLEDFEKVKDSIRRGVLKSYNFLAAVEVLI